MTKRPLWNVSKQTLLEAALKQGLDAPYSCQGGICSSCLARVTSERQKWQKNGSYLLSNPCPETIYVDYDDV
jgi:ring-1,2-phenylacetyl-CoA epoxidase subunit PaaE